MDNEVCRNWYEHSYNSEKLAAQRRYPNEELCRFMGRTWFQLPRAARHDVKILELGCGSGANLWMLKREGFDTYGLDLSPEAIHLAHKMLEFWGADFAPEEGPGHLLVGDMTELPCHCSRPLIAGAKPFQQPRPRRNSYGIAQRFVSCGIALLMNLPFTVRPVAYIRPSVRVALEAFTFHRRQAAHFSAYPYWVG